MNLVVITIAIILVVSGVIYQKNIPPSKQNEEVLSDETSLTVTPSEVPGPLPSVTATPTPTIISKENATPTKAPQITNTTEFIYPNASDIARGNSKISFKSSDNPESITNWYKNEINSRGYSVTSFVTTKTNGNVENKLAGASGEDKLQVKIEKSAESTLTTVVVELN